MMIIDLALRNEKRIHGRETNELAISIIRADFALLLLLVKRKSLFLLELLMSIIFAPYEFLHTHFVRSYRAISRLQSPTIDFTDTELTPAETIRIPLGISRLWRYTK